jgi:hypothetical protein
MPNDPTNDLGLRQVLLERLNTQILPRALALEAKVNRGECLSDQELLLLNELLEDANEKTRLAKDHRELYLLCGRIANLYNEITRKALENQEKERQS